MGDAGIEWIKVVGELLDTDAGVGAPLPAAQVDPNGLTHLPKGLEGDDVWVGGRDRERKAS